MNWLDIKKFEDKKNEKPYQLTWPEKIKVEYVQKRFGAMRKARQKVDRHWETYQTMIDAVFEPYPDGRSSSVVPIASAIIELYVAETIKLKPQFQFRWENSKYDSQAKALE